jgi:ATP-dependent Clp protease protease subunit
MTLKIYNDIVPEEERKFRLMFMGLDGVSFASIDEFIASIPEDDDTIDMRINSPGGVVSEGWGIIDKLRATGKKITATVEGEASSMAALVLLAASERRGYKHATLLIHDAFYHGMFLEKGTAEELEKRAALLREDNERALDFMVERTGADRAVLEALMKEDRPVSMEKAKELGFIHEILEPVSATNTSSTDMSNMKKIASAFKAFAEAVGLSVRMEADEVPVGYVLTAQDGTEINIDKPEGEDPAVGDSATPDGEHLMPDGTVIVITDGLIAEIRDAEPEEAPEADPEDNGGEAPVVDVNAINEAHAAEIAAKDEEIKKLQDRVADLEENVKNLEASQINNEQRDILAKVEKAGGAAWLEKSTKSSYKPAQRIRKDQTVQSTASKTSEALAAARARKAAKRDKVVRKNDEQ